MWFNCKNTWIYVSYIWVFHHISSCLHFWSLYLYLKMFTTIYIFIHFAVNKIIFELFTLVLLAWFYVNVELNLIIFTKFRLFTCQSWEESSVFILFFQIKSLCLCSDAQEKRILEYFILWWMKYSVPLFK